MKIRPSYPAILFALHVLLNGPVVSAATKTWDGSSSGLWNVAANWTGNAAPVNGDALQFPGSPARLLTTNTAGAAVNFTSIQFTGSGYELHGPALSITNGLTNGVFLNGGNTIRSAINVRGAQSWSVSARTSLTLTENANFASHSVTGFIGGTLVLNGILTGTTASRFHKNNGGRMEINGSGVIGQIVVNDGTLQVDGAMGSGGRIIVGVDGALTGSGVASPFTSEGVVSPGGTSPGKLTVLDAGNDVILTTTNSLYTVQINGATPGTGYDQLSVPDQLQLLNSRLTVSVGAGFEPAPGQSFVIITNTSALPVTGTFNGLPQNAIFSVSNTTFRISYTGGSGNDVELTVIGASGDTRIWDGGGASGSWTLAANWDDNIPAFAGDALVFPSSVPATERTNQNTFPAGTPFNRLVLGGTNWNITGNAIRLLNGLEVTNRTVGPIPVIDLPITLDTNQTWSVRTNSLTKRGAVDLGTNTLVALVFNGQLRLIGSITGTGAARIIKRGTGDLDLSGTNTFPGGVRIESGLVNASGLHLTGQPWELASPAGRVMITRMVPGLNASSGRVQIPFLSSGSHVAGNLNLSPTVTLDYLDAINTLSVTGVVNLAGATLTGLPDSGGLQFGVTESVLIQNDGNDAVIGTFAGLPEGTFVETSSAGLSNIITYVGGDGNDVALRTVPPEATRLTRIWDGDGTNASWTTSGNWVANIRPRTGDDILFPVNAQQKQNHVNTENTFTIFLANSLRFEGADYVLTNLLSGSPFSFNLGVVSLTEGIVAAQPFGQNTLSTIVGVMADQDWEVASEEATLRFNGVAMGQATVRKTGLGRLESTGALFTNGVRFVNAAGSSHFENTGLEAITVGGGITEMLRSGARSLVATGGLTHLAGTVAPSLSVTGAQLHAMAGTVDSGAVLTPNATTNFNLGPGARCVVEFPASNSVAFLLLGAMNINGAQLDVQVSYPIRSGERLSVAAPYPAGSFVPFPPIFPLPTNQPPPAVITGTFVGLPDGAVRIFSGRPFRINYALTNGQIVLPGVFLTALPIAPRFNKIARPPSGIVSLHGFAERGSVVLLEGSQDFDQWTLLDTTLTSDGGEFTLRDTFAPGLPFRFYRAKTE